MPSTNKTSAEWSSTSLNAKSDRWRLFISATRCATMRNISSSTKALRTSSASYHSSTAPVTLTLFLPSSWQESAEGATASARSKFGKKLAESEEDLLEHYTDGSDTLDTFYIGCEKFPIHDIVSVPVSGVMLSKIPPQTAINLPFLPFFLF